MNQSPTGTIEVTLTAYDASHYAHVMLCERCGCLRTDWERDRQCFPLCWHCAEEFSEECWRDVREQQAEADAAAARWLHHEKQKGGAA